ncbi:hypothetical protein [Roseomonas mucosa]
MKISTNRRRLLQATSGLFFSESGHSRALESSLNLNLTGAEKNFDQLLGINIWKLLPSNFSSPHIKNFMTSVKPSFVRFPPGEAANFWDARVGTIYPAARPEVSFKYDTEPFPLKKFVEFTKIYSLSISYIVNMTSDASGINGGNLQDQLNAIDVIRKLGGRISRVELGNELYSESDKLDQYKQRIFPSGELFSQKAQIWIDQIKNLLPTAKFGAPFAESQNTSRRKEWNKSVAQISSLTALIIHPYFRDGLKISPEKIGSEQAKIMQDNLLNSGRSTDVILTQPIRRVKQLKHMTQSISGKKELWINEYDLVDSIGQLKGRWLHALAFARFSLQLLELDGINAIAPYNILGDPETFEIFSGFNDFSGVLGAKPTIPGELTATGMALQILGEAAFKSTAASQVDFSDEDSLGGIKTSLKTLYGWIFLNPKPRLFLINSSPNLFHCKKLRQFSHCRSFSADPLQRIYSYQDMSISDQTIGPGSAIPPYSLNLLT